MAAPRIAIVGGGIGGMTAAAALVRAGAEVMLLERAQSFDHMRVGGGIHVWPNGQRALAELGGLDLTLVEELEPEAWLKRATFETARGKTLMRWDTHDTRCVLRGTLHRVLTDAVPADAVRLGAHVERVDGGADGAVIRLAGGEEIAVDAVVGADGVRSGVRELLLGDGPPRYAGYSTWTGVVEFDDPRAPAGHFRVLFGRGARFVSFAVGRARIYWEASVALPEGGPDPEGRRREAVLAHFREFVAPTPELVEATVETAITRGDVYDRPPAERWGKGRVTLLGDAAHPMTNALGQGANQAMEDGVVLGRCIGEHEGVEDAFRAYERRRTVRTSPMVKTAHWLAWMHMWRRRPAVVARNVAFRTLGPIVRDRSRRDIEHDFLAG